MASVCGWRGVSCSVKRLRGAGVVVSVWQLVCQAGGAFVLSRSVRVELALALSWRCGQRLRMAGRQLLCEAFALSWRCGQRLAACVSSWRGSCVESKRLR